MRLVDAHCHLESDAFADSLDDVLEDGRRAGIAAFVTSTASPEEWAVSEALAQRYPDVYFAIGIHPAFVAPEHLDLVEDLRHARERGAVAIGEIGLDRKIDAPSFDLQRQLFEAQLRIAADLDLPVVIHCRAAFQELIETLKEIPAPRSGGIVHAFSGSVEVAQSLVKHGLSFSLGGGLTYRNSKKRAAVLRYAFPDRLLLETDSPDIPPVEVRGTGQPNVPANITYNLRAAAETLDVPEQEIAERTTANAARLFGLQLGAAP